MKVERFLPTERLQPFIRSFMITESDSELNNRVLPDTSIAMAFRLKGRTGHVTEKAIENTLPFSVISGLRYSPRLIHYSPQSANLIVMFKEGGAGMFFNEPLHELFGMTVSLCDFMNSQKLIEVEERLAEANSNRQKITIVEQFLISQLNQSHADPLIASAIKTMKATYGNLQVKELLSCLPISRDPFEKRFRKITGTSPKQFSSILRMQHLIGQYSGKVKLTDVALEAGYFDQSHFIKEFKIFSGQTPKEFFKTPPLW